MEALKLIGWIVAWAIAILCSGWAAAALYFDFPSTRFNIVAAGIFIALVVLAIIFARGRVIKLVTVFAAFGLVLVWWRTLQPPRDREWAPEVAQTGWADISGDDVTLHNVRNCDYRSENDFDARWETRTVRLSQLQGMDLLIMYWGSPYMAHPIVSFRFADALPICFSIETRKAVGQGYSALRGLFRQYTLIYIVADERDSVRVRAKYRHGEEVYLYRTLASPAQARARFMEYVSALNKLHDQPRWYNAITTNCTTSIREQRAVDRRTPWDWRLLVNGKADELLYERKLIATGGLPFAELKRRSQINERAQAADKDPEFSRRIREGVPGFSSDQF